MFSHVLCAVRDRTEVPAALLRAARIFSELKRPNASQTQLLKLLGTCTAFISALPALLPEVFEFGWFYLLIFAGLILETEPLVTAFFSATDLK